MHHTLKLLLALPLLYHSPSCFSQVDSTSNKWVLGVDMGTLASAGTRDLNYYAHLTADKAHWSFGIAPVIGRHYWLSGYETFGITRGSYRLNGGDLAIQLFPNKKAKTFDLLFQYNLLYLKLKDSGNDYNFSLYGDPYIAKRWSIENTIGYGFNIKFLKNAYINHSIQAGWIHASTRVNFEQYPDELRSLTSELTYMAKLAVGYKFALQ